MKRLKGIISLVLTLCILASSTAVVSSAEETYSGFDCMLRFRGTSSFSMGDVHVMTSIQHWDDNYFSVDSSVFNEKLAKLLCVMAASSYYGYTERTENIKYNLNELGFQDAEFYYKPKEYTKDSEYYNEDGVSYSLARKEVEYDGEDCTLICVTIKGTSNDEEWYGNFNVGTETDHKGFSISANIVRTALEKYIEKYVKTDNVKIITTGHSRGAATANAFAASLIDKPKCGGVTLKSKDVFAYTYATPTTTMRTDCHDKKYGGIFNFVNPEDFIGYTPLPMWGYERYGVDIFLPNRISDYYYDSSLSLMQRDFANNTRGGTYVPFANGAAETIMFTKKATALMPKAEDLYNKKYFVNGSLMSGHELLLNACDILINTSESGSAFLNLLGSKNSAFSILMDFILNTYMGSNGATDAFTYNHSPITFISWVNSMSREEMLLERHYKEIVLTKNATVYVTDLTTDNIVAIVSNGVVDESMSEGPVITVDGDFSHLYLPSHGSYSISILGVKDEEFDISCMYSLPNGKVIQNSVYEGIRNSQGDEFTLISMSNDTLVSLFRGDLKGTPINPTKHSEKNKPFTVKSTVSQSGNGETVFKPEYTGGEVVYVYAYPYQNSEEEFVCWYRDGRKVSTEKEYSYLSTDNSEISALYLDPAQKIYRGDANESKTETDMADVVTIQKDIAKISTMSALSRYSSDVSNDGITNMSDAVILQRYIAGLLKDLN